MQSDTDAALARRIQKGDDAAFTLLVERYQDRMFRLAKGMLYNAGGAEDATQEVFLRAYTGLGRFRFRSTVYTWLFSMLRNVCREINRRDARAPLTLDHEPGDDLADPSRRVIASERLEQVMQRVRELPDRQRDVVLLRVFEGLSVVETAKVLRCREGTVKVHLHRAMKVLKSLGGSDEVETK